MRAFTVYYTMYQHEETKEISLLAKNKEDAYIRAIYEVIPEKEGKIPYSAWVHSVTYQNGKYHTFNTCDTQPY